MSVQSSHTLRVLMISWEYPPHIVGGMGRHVTDLAEMLINEGADVHVITPLLRAGDPYECTPGGVHVHRIAMRSMDDYSYVTFVRESNVLLEAAALQLHGEVGGFSLIHAHDWLTADVAIALKHAWRRPLVATIHATERGRLQGSLNGNQSHLINYLEWRLTFEAWRVIACSQFMAQQIQDYFNLPADKVDVISNGVNVRPPPLPTEEARKAFRRRFVSDDQQLVFSIGRMVYEKGIQVLINAWPAVLREFPGARLVLAGTGPHLPALKQLAWNLGLEHSIMFVGFISDEERDRLYAIADLAVFPSIYEPFGIVALEAMATRCPVLVADTGGLGEVVRLYETGLTSFVNDSESLGWGILKALSEPAEALACAETAFQEVQEIYNWQRIATQTARVYRRVYDEWVQNPWGAALALRAE